MGLVSLGSWEEGEVGGKVCPRLDMGVTVSRGSKYLLLSRETLHHGQLQGACRETRARDTCIGAPAQPLPCVHGLYILFEIRYL